MKEKYKFANIQLIALLEYSTSNCSVYVTNKMHHFGCILLSTLIFTKRYSDKSGHMDMHIEKDQMNERCSRTRTTF